MSRRGCRRRKRGWWGRRAGRYAQDISSKELDMVRTIRWVGPVEGGPVSLPKMLLPDDEGQRLDEARWHGLGFEGEPTWRPRVEPDIDSVLNDKSSRNVTYPRIWPVPGDGESATRGTLGPNGRAYADGRYSPDARYRIDRKTGKPRPHYGIDLPAATGTDVIAADDGIVRSAVPDPHGFGTNVVLDYGPTQGIYAHLGPGEPPPLGSHVAQGQKIGKVGTSGSATGGGDHLHYEVRLDQGGRTWRRPLKTGGGVPVDPTIWEGQRVSRPSRLDD